MANSRAWKYIHVYVNASPCLELAVIYPCVVDWAQSTNQPNKAAEILQCLNKLWASVYDILHPRRKCAGKRGWECGCWGVEEGSLCLDPADSPNGSSPRRSLGTILGCVTVLCHTVDSEQGTAACARDTCQSCRFPSSVVEFVADHGAMAINFVPITTKVLAELVCRRNSGHGDSECSVWNSSFSPKQQQQQQKTTKTTTTKSSHHLVSRPLPVPFRRRLGVKLSGTNERTCGTVSLGLEGSAEFDWFL